MNLEERAGELTLVAIKRITSVRGLAAKIYRRLGLKSHLALAMNWPRGIPMQHVFIVSQVSKIQPEQLRPDVFLHDPLRREATLQYCKVGPRAGKFIEPTYKNKRSLPDTEEHRAMLAIWFDRVAYRTAPVAAAAASQSVSALYRRFGPRLPGHRHRQPFVQMSPAGAVFAEPH